MSPLRLKVTSKSTAEVAFPMVEAVWRIGWLVEEGVCVKEVNAGDKNPDSVELSVYRKGELEESERGETVVVEGDEDWMNEKSLRRKEQEVLWAGLPLIFTDPITKVGRCRDWHKGSLKNE